MTTASLRQDEHVPEPTQERSFDWRRACYAVLAVIAWSGLALSCYLNLTDPTYWPTVAERFSYWISFFTILSNFVVAVVTTMLAIDPQRRGRWFDATRMSSLVMITVTGLVYNLVLAPANAAAGTTPTGLGAVSDNLLHVIVPILTVVGFLVVDRRGRMDLPALVRSLVLPIAWLGYTLVRGAIVGWYPYPFMDVIDLGYLRAVMNCAAVVVLGLVLGAMFLAYDRFSRLGRVQDQS